MQTVIKIGEGVLTISNRLTDQIQLTGTEREKQVMNEQGPT